MVKLVQIFGHSELVSEIAKQFAFMAVENCCESEFNFNKLIKDASDHFQEYADDMGMIDQSAIKDADITAELTMFLSKYNKVFDVEAIQQNIHYCLKVLDDQIEKDIADCKMEFGSV